jgi:lysylphosphatidylglycerol synthetase-like protein (DUF2156 family)
MTAVAPGTTPDVTAAPEGADGRLSERDLRALTLLRTHGDHSSAFLTFNDETQHYMPDEVEGLVAYRFAGRRHAMQLCGPVCAPEDRERLLSSFRSWCRSQGRAVTAVQLTRADAEMYAGQGFVVNQFGSTYSIELDGFTLRGTKFMKVRNKLKRARRLGVEVEELAGDRRFDPEVERELAAIDADWLRGKGRLAKEMAFMIGERGGRGRPYRRVFVARVEGRAMAYVTYSPVFGSRPGWLYDLTRRRVDAPPGTVEVIFETALTRIREEGWKWLHLGLTPSVGLSPEHEIPEARHAVAGFVTRMLGEKGEFIYPAKTQEAFKLKWGPQVIEPEYMAFEGKLRPSAVFQLMRVTRSI